MKNIILGIMITSVSVSFAQTQEVQTHQLKNQFAAKQKVAVLLNEMDQSANQQAAPIISETGAKSELVNGVIRVQDGTAFIISESGAIAQRMLPVNLPKGFGYDGQHIQFRYSDSDEKMAEKSKGAKVVNVFDVTAAPKK